MRNISCTPGSFLLTLSFPHTKLIFLKIYDLLLDSVQFPSEESGKKALVNYLFFEDGCDQI